MDEFVNEVEITEAPRKRTKTHLAKVMTRSKNGFAGIEFKGYGVQLRVFNELHVGDTIAVKYVSDIGQKDFEIWAE